MIVLRFVEHGECGDLCHDGIAVYFGPGEVCYDALGCFLLLVIAIEDGRAVLRTRIGTLAIERSRIMYSKEHFEYFIQVCFGLIVGDLHGFGMAGIAGAYIAVGWVFHIATSEA